MDTNFYKTEGLLARDRGNCPEMLRENTGEWHPYPGLDVTMCHSIGRDEAAGMLPAGKPASHLDAPGELDRQHAKTVKAPVRR